MDVKRGQLVKMHVERFRPCDLWRDRTAEEHAAWEASDESKGMNCAGESKLDSPSRYRRPADGEVLTVVRARCTAQKGWHTVGKCALLRDANGVEWYARRSDLRPVEA